MFGYLVCLLGCDCLMFDCGFELVIWFVRLEFWLFCLVGCVLLYLFVNSVAGILLFGVLPLLLI